MFDGTSVPYMAYNLQIIFLQNYKTVFVWRIQEK